MADNVTRGKLGEDLAAEFLINKGYSILKRNYRSGKGEIDLIATCENLLVFVEVKMRAYDRYGYPETAVNQQKQKMVIKTAESFIEEVNWNQEIRFDIIAITGKNIIHLEDAFD